MWSEDVILETLRAIVVLILIFLMLRAYKKDMQIKSLAGSKYIFIGFILIAFGSLIDITDNFPQLNHYIVIGDTPVEAFLEKVVGYLCGFVLLALGIHQWLPKVISYKAHMQQQLYQSQHEVKKLQALLPICARCKKIRDEQNHWQPIESYISKHTESEFSHGFCPDCLEAEKAKLPHS